MDDRDQEQEQLDRRLGLRDLANSIFSWYRRLEGWAAPTADELLMQWRNDAGAPPVDDGNAGQQSQANSESIRQIASEEVDGMADMLQEAIEAQQRLLDADSRQSLALASCIERAVMSLEIGCKSCRFWLRRRTTAFEYLAACCTETMTECWANVRVDMVRLIADLRVSSHHEIDETDDIHEPIDDERKSIVSVDHNTIWIAGHPNKADTCDGWSVEPWVAIVIDELVSAFNSRMGAMSGSHLNNLPGCSGKNISRDLRNAIRRDVPPIIDLLGASSGSGHGYWLTE